MNQRWEIHHIREDVADVHDGLIVLEWVLNQTPDPRWSEYFVKGPGGRSGSGDFLSRVPDVRANKIVFTVLDEDMKSAVDWVKARIVAVNQWFGVEVVAKEQEQKARREAEEAAKERQLRDARERLRRLDP